MIFDGWKKEWWINHAKTLSEEYQGSIRDLEDKWTQKKNSKLLQIELGQEELEHRLQKLKESNIEAQSKENALREQIKLLEAKASPSGVWVQAFTAGFNKAWEMKEPLMADGILRMKRLIEEEAINRTLNGNPKNK